VPNLPSAAGPRLQGARRRELGGAYREGGEHYERVRPGYPPASADWVLADGGSTVVDIGAGTGKFTGLLTGRGLEVTAVDPSADMLAQLELRLPEVRTVPGTAERPGLPPSSQDSATVAQAWHWFDAPAASAGIARVLRPGGSLGIIWNQLDVGVPWVHRLSRIMHAGDVHRPDFAPPLGPEFGAPELLLTRWRQACTPEDLLELAKSRSYYLRADEGTRGRVLGNLSWYVFEHLSHPAGGTLQLPYVTAAWRTRKR
jgi:SAM-dependent methyltransferase